MVQKFSINGQQYTVDFERTPVDITLNTFIREHAGLPGTKFMCEEGGCGACICVATGKHPATGEIRSWAVNSCLTLLNTCDNLEITTVEGIGNKRNGYHAIQQRLAKMNATQCGYCSPGIVMNMHGLLESKGGKVTMEEVENAFGGNLCRCTGYRPILDAMKSFAVDSNIEVPLECRDIEDLGAKTCPKTGNACNNSCKSYASTKIGNSTDNAWWYRERNVAGIFDALAKIGKNKYMLVAGNTAHGVYRRDPTISHFVDVSDVQELHEHKLTDVILTLGANLSLTDAMDIFKTAAKQPGFEYCEQLWQHFDLIANVPVRNMGTLAGNLSIKHQYKEFPSDVFIVFEALDARVLISESASKKTSLSLSEYLKTPMDGKIITAFELKAYPQERYIFNSYKIMPRAQNAHAYVNAAFLFDVERPSLKVNAARICFGGISPDFVHAKDIEQRFAGKQIFDQNILTEVFNSLKTKLKADYVLPDPTPEYRQKLAAGLLFKFILANVPAGKISEKLLSGGEILKRPVSSGTQKFKTVETSFPIGLPTEKHEGIMQASGEATYANDLPVQPNQLWAAFVPAKKVGATVTDFDTSAAFALPGVIAFFSAKDIPGVNTVVPEVEFFWPKNEQLFVEGPVKFHNQPAGLIVAESNALANRAAELVKLTYEGGSTEVFPTVQDVLNSACSDRIDATVPSTITDLKIPSEVDVTGKGTLDMGLQFHFYMEPQTTVAVPFEGGLQLHTATQWMDMVQIAVANLLNIKNNEVQISVRRLGGGYGGKASRCNPAACGAALAAFKLNRPVRFVQSLESIMTTLGKRWPCYSDYEFHAKKNGEILALRNSFYEDAGYSANESPMGHTVMLAKNCYQFIDNFKSDGYMVFTDTPSNTPCRAPGSLEGIAMIENIVEHIAFESGLDPLEVRKNNLIPGHKIHEFIAHFEETSNYKQRRQEVVAFNEKNRWRKRGLGVSIMEYQIGYFGQYPATVAIYHGDGTVVISHGGIEMGQGMNTKIAQVAAHTLGIPLDYVRVEGSNTINGANSMVTGGAVGSETLCFAVRKCCTTLNQRLEPVKEGLKGAKWPEIVEKAYADKILMIATDDCKAGDMQPYTVCGLALTEVEVDMLTGNYLINRVDLLEDSGESLNPNVDVGQIEGAFIMGLSYWTTEQCIFDKTTAELKTNRTWNYKIIGAKDIPVDFRIELLPKIANQAGFMRSKATGEPAICLGISAVFALQQAIQSARDDAGLKRSWVNLSAPMTPEHVLLSAGTDMDLLKLS